jgi:hypothetical protein
MKGKLNRINGKWFVEYSTSSYSGGNPKQLGSYTKKVEQKRLELTPNNQRYMNCFLFVDKDTRVDFKEVFINPMGREVDPNNLGQNHSGCVWYAELTYDENGVKDEQKQHLINIMESDEELGLYEQIDQNNPITKGSTTLVKEIKLEDVFNDEKREGVKDLIDLHIKYEETYTNKEIRTWWLNQTEERRRNMVREYFKNGNSEGINTLYGIMPEEMEEIYNINVDVVIMDWEEILFDFIDFYPCQLPDELFEWLKENYEIPKKK